ncbi:glycosyltransferase [Acidisoma sp. 7E03]
MPLVQTGADHVEPLGPEAPSPATPGETSQDSFREAILKREIARLTRERNRLADTADALRAELALFRPKKAPIPAAPLAPDNPELLRLQRIIAAKDALIRSLFGSTSWKLTAPLRALSAALGRGATPSLEQALAATLAVDETSPAAVIPPPPGSPAAADAPLRLAAKVHEPPKRRGRGVVLIVADYLPLFDQQSGGLRLKTLMGLILDLGWEVVFCSFLGVEDQPGILATAEGRKRYETALRAMGIRVLVYGQEATRDYLRQNGREVRHALISAPIVAIDFIPLVRLHCPWARILYDMLDFHYLRMSREATLAGDPALQAAADETLAMERACIGGADLTLAVTAEEKAAVLPHAPNAVVEVLPNVFDMPTEEAPGPEGRRDLLFVGGFWHKPNGDAVRWFVQEIWPLLHREMPDLVFRVVGANADEDILALHGQRNVEILGFVPDLAPLQRRSRVFVAPLRYGAGMKGKVGQSLAHGLPVVATQIGAEGMALEDGVHLLVAESPADFAAQVLRLLRDDDLWRSLQREGRDLIARTLSADVVRSKLDALLHD